MVIGDCGSLLDAPAAVTNLVLEGDLAIRRDHHFVLPFLTGNEGVAWAEMDGIPVGCQAWSRKHEGRVWWYEVSYVLPAYRKQGVLAEVRKRVRELAQADGAVKFIEYLIACDNEAMVHSVNRVGMQPANFHYRFEVRR